MQDDSRHSVPLTLVAFLLLPLALIVYNPHVARSALEWVELMVLAVLPAVISIALSKNRYLEGILF